MLVSISNPQEAFIAKDGSATEKADAIFKFICEKVIEYWSLDKNPRPLSIAQASRISGVNPVDISILAVYLKKEYSKNE